MNHEARMVRLARNVLQVAGAEIGAEGDHWPAIKWAMHGIEQQFAELQAERNVAAELEEHLMQIMHDYEQVLADAPPAVAAALRPVVADMRDLYAARFEPVDALAKMRPVEMEQGPQPWRVLEQVSREMREQAHD